MSTPPFPTPPRAITHAELTRELNQVRRFEKAAKEGIKEAVNEAVEHDCSDEAAFYQGQRHLPMRLLKKSEGGK